MNPTALCRLAGFFSAGKSDLACEIGLTRTPSVGAESMATPADPRPRASSSWVRVPPKEWPMMIGGALDRLDGGLEVVERLGHGQVRR